MISVTKHTYREPEFNLKEILRYAGCRDSEEQMLDLMCSCIDEIRGKLTYNVCHAAFPVTIYKNTCDLTFAKTSSSALIKNLSDCDSIILFAATVGIEIDRLIIKYGKLSPSRAFFFQAIGAERIETLCDIFCDELAQKYDIKPRFSPGYGDLPLEIQKDIFDALSCSKHIGISLNESLLISPSKSVTAIVGIKTKGK